MTKSATPPLVRVKKSAIQGRGVFATRDIAKGTRIIEYRGERITHEEANERYDDAEMRRHHTFLFTVNDKVVIDAGGWGNEAKYINHSCAPNCEARVVRGRVFIYARRAILAGAELLYDYWYTVDDGYTDEELRGLYPCRCGAKRCRGTIAAPRKKPRRKRAATPEAPST